MRSSMSATAPAPPPPLAMEGGTAAAPNPATFVRALDPPKYGFDRYVEQHLANAGGRTLKGKGSKGNIYTSGHFAGKTQGQAIEMMRAAYAGMSDEARAPFEAGANGRDVMSATEQATLARHDLARGVAAGGGMGQSPPTQSPVTPRSITEPAPTSVPAPAPVPTSPPPSPSPSPPARPGGILEQTPNGKVTAERQADGTIKRTLNGVSVDAQGKALPPPTPAIPAPGMIPRSIEGALGGRSENAPKGVGPTRAAAATLANDQLREQLKASWARGKAAMKEAEKPVTVPKEITSTVEPPAFIPTDYDAKGRNETLADTFEPTGKKKPVVASR